MNECMDRGKVLRSLKKAVRSMMAALPLIVGIFLLFGLFKTFIPTSWYVNAFNYNEVLNSILGSVVGSILAGNPITSYIIGGELMDQGVSLVAITAFLVAWVSVGVVTLPVEATYLGRRYAIIRNMLCFFFSIGVALVTVAILEVVA